MSDRLAPLHAPLQATALVAAGGGVALVATRNLLAALVLALLPAAALLATRPAFAAILGVGLIPLAPEAVPDFPIKVSVPDVLLLVAVLGGLLVVRREQWRRLKPLVPFVIAYAAVLLVVLAVTPGAAAFVNATQRMQILLVPLVVGGVLLGRQNLQRALTLYVVTATVLAAAWSADLIPDAVSFQKNPVGQFIAGALLVITAQPGQRWRLLLVPPLAWGLFQTESRGAILALLVGLVVLFLARPGADRLRSAAVLVPIFLVLGVVYTSLPDDVQSRTTTFTVQDDGTRTEAEYTIRIREAYRDDALEIIRANPYTGVGIGNYVAGVATDGTLSRDPHNVLLLEAAEGGLPLAAGFMVLIGGSLVVVWRRRRDTPLAPLALAVQASIVSHGLVDVYWVRGTPLLGWVLVGAVLADAHRRRRAAG